MRILGGHPALDFLNTVGGRTHSNAVRYVVDREHLHTIDDLLDWAAEAKIVTGAERKRLLDSARAHPRAAAALLARALEFREALYRVFKSVIEAGKPDPADLDILNGELAEARAHERLGVAAGQIAIEWDDRGALEHPLRVVARAAAELLTSDQMSRVKQCGGESCGWLFFDTTRNRSRQWCDMRDCGNVAKVRRFRERRKGRA